MPTLRIATRGSRLALCQSEEVAAELRRAHPEIVIELVPVETEGDRDRQTPLSVLGGRGVFVKAVEAALLRGRADLAVHSLKDLPTEDAAGLTVAAVPRRADPRDALVAPGGRTLRELPAGSRVGTSSRRRAALLRAIRPDLRAVEIRGNVDTRIDKVRHGEAEAALLAVAGLARLGRAGEAGQIFEALDFLPSPGQGALAVQCRADDARTVELLSHLDHPASRLATTAERSLLAALGSGCSLPVGAYGRIEGAVLALRGMLVREGQELPDFGDASGPPEEAEALGRELGLRLLAGAPEGGGR